jgi:hypothetical protein
VSVLNRLFAKALTLDIGGQEVAFQGLAEFEFSLSGRTDVPARKVADLLDLTPSELKQEAQAIKAVEQRFVDIMAKAIEAPATIGDLIRGVDPLVFSQDHQWRDIVRALNEQGEEFDELRRIALVKYMQYLRARQDVIKQLYKFKKQVTGAPEASAGETQMVDLASVQPPSHLRDTLLFEPAAAEPEPASDGEFARLPKGEAMTVQVAPAIGLPLRFSQHAFVLLGGARFELVDDQQRRLSLAEGRNIVGRDSMCNVVVDNAYRDVSRVHCLIEPLGADQARITDLSAHGTFLPKRSLVTT